MFRHLYNLKKAFTYKETYPSDLPCLFRTEFADAYFSKSPIKLILPGLTQGQLFKSLSFLIFPFPFLGKAGFRAHSFICLCFKQEIRRRVMRQIDSVYCWASMLKSNSFLTIKPINSHSELFLHQHYQSIVFF